MADIKEPLIADKVSFTQFKRDALMHKFGQVGFVLLYGHVIGGWKYRIVLRGSNQLAAFRSAYYLLYGYTDGDEIEMHVRIGEDNNPSKMPVSCNFGFAFSCRQMENKDWFDICMKPVGLPKKDLVCI